MNEIIRLNFKSGSSLSAGDIDRKLKHSFGKIKEEMDEHLQAINENTNEITSNYEYICELEAKIGRLTERMDKMQMFIEAHIGAESPAVEQIEIKPLSKAEQDVFTALYILQEEKGTVTFADIAEMARIEVEEVSAHVASMISKGVPVSKKFIDNEPYLKLDKEFKTLQAKENILHIVH